MKNNGLCRIVGALLVTSMTLTAKDGIPPSHTKETSIFTNPIKYSSYYYDYESGACYCAARYYSPELAAFITRDTWNVLNRYAYCSNNPVMYSDSTGHTRDEVGKIICPKPWHPDNPMEPRPESADIRLTAQPQAAVCTNTGKPPRRYFKRRGHLCVAEFSNTRPTQPTQALVTIQAAPPIRRERTMFQASRITRAQPLEPVANMIASAAVQADPNYDTNYSRHNYPLFDLRDRTAPIAGPEVFRLEFRKEPIDLPSFEEYFGINPPRS